MKVCSKCGEEKPLSEFNKQNKNKLQSHCRLCERYRQLLINHGITSLKYEEMLSAQDGVCYFCKGGCFKGYLSVDHDHATGEVRWLLCSKCNVTLGNVNDDPYLLRAMADALESRVSYTGN
jgi:hypothetical protein